MHSNRRFLPALLLLALLTCGALHTARAQQPPPPRKGGVVAGPIITLPRGSGDPTLEQATAADAPTKLRAPRWEYCAIMSFTMEKRSTAGPVMSLANICYFREDGCTVESVEMEGADKRQAVTAKAIARLGADGWEMVGLGPGQTDVLGMLGSDGGMISSPFVLYFKRPLQ